MSRLFIEATRFIEKYFENDVVCLAIGASPVANVLIGYRDPDFILIQAGLAIVAVINHCRRQDINHNWIDDHVQIGF